MGIEQNKAPPKKTEEQIKMDMKRKWDNFASNESSKINQEEEKKQEPLSQEEEKQGEENKEEEKEVEKEEEKKEEKKIAFLSLKPREEQQNENENFGQNEEDNKDNEEKLTNQNQIISNNIEINEDKNNEINDKQEIKNNTKENIEEQNNNNENNNEDNNQNNEINNNNDINKKEDENVENNKEENNKNNIEEEKQKSPKKNIDLENVTIEKVFHITLSEENPKKYLYLELYLAKILSLGQSPSFKLDNLDDIIITVINEPSIKQNLLNYLLDCFHRAYEIIEVRYKDTLSSDFAQIHLAIATYFGQVVSSPESFELNINKKQISEIIKNYYLKTSEEEFLFLFKDITINCGDDLDSLSLVLHYLFEIMHMENIDKQTFFKGVAIKKNLNLLLRILSDYPKVRAVFLKDALYNPANINGRLMQALSFYGPYLSYSPLDTPIEQQRNSFKQFANDSELKSYISKLNNIIETLSEIIKILEEFDDEKSLNYFFSVININFDWQKTVKNFMILSSHGFLLNIFYLSLDLFFSECQKSIKEENFNKNKDYVIKAIKHINTKFCLNDKKIIFSKFNPIYAIISKEYMESNKGKSEGIKYNKITKLFFICHSLMNYIIPALTKFYMEASKAASQAFSTLGLNNPQTKENIIKLKLFDIYVKNDKFVKYILEFNEITTFFLITLNNSKYAHNDEYSEIENNNENTINEEEEYNTFKINYYKYMDAKSNIVISSLPEFLILNMVNSCVFFRQANRDLFFKDYDSSEIIKG